jgi:hypothetical protein
VEIALCGGIARDRVQPTYIVLAGQVLHDSGATVVTVVGFPHGRHHQPVASRRPVYRNTMLVDSIAGGVRQLMEFEPELLLTGHTGAHRGKTLHAWAKSLEGVFTTW